MGVLERRLVSTAMPFYQATSLKLPTGCSRWPRNCSQPGCACPSLTCPIILSGRIFNARACIAAANKDLETAAAFLEAALDCYPHHDVMENRERLKNRLSRGGALSGKPLVLSCEDHFETNRICCAPEHPDPQPLPANLYET